jgi:M6 family metalloprotease-like protein
VQVNGSSKIGRRGITWLLAALLMAGAMTAGAAPMRGDVVSIRQPDGTSVAVRVWGDEFYAVGETLDGYAVVRDANTGMLCYAALSDDGRELVSTGTPAGQEPPAGLEPHVRIDPDAASAQARSSRDEFERLARESLPTAQRSGERGPTTGSVVGITLLIDFDDEPATIPTSTVDDYCNLPGYTGGGNNGSVRDYFYDVSEGLLEYTNYVPTVYYRAIKLKSYYTDPSAPYGKRARELITEALEAMDDAGFDFSLYDADGNGIVDALNCFYAGGIWNVWAEGLWPHAGWMEFCADGVCTERYQITDMGSSLGLGTFCHENGHMLMGWPDLYDYDGDSAGVGRFCLMCYSGSGTNPVEPCAYMKLIAGWADVTLPATPETELVVPVDGNVMYKFNHPSDSHEYYLIENRQRTDRDAALPDDGLAIWHVDTDGDNSNQQQTPSSHYLVTLVQADGAWDLENDRNTGDNTDLYAAPQYVMCTPETHPNTDWWDGSESGLCFMDVSASAAVMTFDYGNLPPPCPAGVAAEARELSVSVTWNEVPSPDLDHYRVERDTTALFGSGTESLTSYGTELVDGPLTAGREYFFRVRAVDLGGLESSPSDTVSAFPLENVPPSAPTGFVVLAGSSVVLLQWSANPEVDIAGYRVERDSTTAFAEPESLGFSSEPLYVDATAAAGRAYWYRVLAEDEMGYLSSWGAPVAGIAVPGHALYVDASNIGPENGSYAYPYRAIQSGIDEASAGDVVFVLPGDYAGNVQLKNGVSTIGMFGADSTTVTSAVSALGAGAGTTFKGFAVDGLGSVSTGLDCFASSLIIEDCVFASTTNTAVSLHHGSEGVIRRTRFETNQTAVTCADSAAPVIASNTFESSSFAHVLSMGDPGPTVGGSLAAANDFLDRGLYAIMNIGPSVLAAEYNYWGDDCVESSWFSGSVDYTPWTDAAHTLEFTDCGVGVPDEGFPTAAYASPSFPNPLNPGTTIAFGLSAPGGSASVRVYSVTGRLVRTLLDESLPPGHHAAHWDGKDDRGENVSSGVYFYRIEAPGLESRGKMIVLR